MSPSEVIIAVYIMPEDALIGALFPFSLKTLVLQGGGKFSTLPFFVTSRPGYTAWLLCVLTVGWEVPAAAGSCLPWGPLHSPGPICRASTLPSLAWPRGFLFLLNGRRHYIESL